MHTDHKLTSTITFTLMLATMGLGWFTFNDKLSMPKIDIKGSLARPASSEQDVTSRLWEDPLQAVQAAKAHDPKEHQVSNLQETIQQKLEDKNRQVCLLVVPIPGTPFPNDVETRLRLRYSIQMALANQRCLPENRDHLGFVKLPSPSSEEMHAHFNAVEENSPSIKTEESQDKNHSEETDSDHHEGHKVMDVPFEWFTAETKTNVVSVLTIWLPEEWLGNEPLCRLAYLRKELTSIDNKPERCIGPYIVGPRSSDLLKKMALKKDAKTNDPCNIILSNRLHIFSPQATAPDVLLGLDSNDDWQDARSNMNARLREQLSDTSQNRIYFENFIAPDDQLTDLLVRELDLRRVNLKSDEADQDRILILAEADTAYGRSLPMAFQASLESFREEIRDEGIQSNQSKTSSKLKEIAAKPNTSTKNLIIARYLKGLDTHKGSEGNDSVNTNNGSLSGEQILANALNKKSAPAFGESQLDYTERLADQLARRTKDKPVKAVGILGGDIYDKLILLRSLRSRFEEALFFTTDLDARLWHPSHFKLTRNLVVASAHDVKAPDSADNDTNLAPFRDVYQVAVFNACIAAIKMATGNPYDKPDLLPAIYEIGRLGPVELEPAVQESQESSNENEEETTDNKPDTSDTPKINFLPVILFTFACGLGATILCVNFRSGCRNLFQAKTGWIGYFLLGALFSLVVFRLAATELSTQAGGEPWSWIEGVSIWPTELLRLLIIFVVVWMLVWSWNRHLAHRHRLEEEYQLGTDQGPQPEANSDKTNTYQRVFKQSWPQLIQRAGAGPLIAIDAVEVFKSYLIKGTLDARYARAAIGASIYFCLAMGLMQSAGMPLDTHIRGTSAFVIDKVILFTSIFVWLALVFYVLDAVFLAAQMLNRIGEPFTVWPKTLREKHEDELKVREDDLEGYLDVQFAAVKTQETGKLVLLPFLIQFVMLVARNSRFDNWSWPTALLFIFVGNMVLSTIGWVILRRSAANIKKSALDALGDNLRETERDIASETSTEPAPKVRKIGLLEIKRRIEEERRGAYARWFQDPAVLAMLIPTGLLGILSILFQALFGFM